jgi:hypothetical protein
MDGHGGATINLARRHEQVIFHLVRSAPLGTDPGLPAPFLTLA